MMQVRKEEGREAGRQGGRQAGRQQGRRGEPSQPCLQSTPFRVTEWQGRAKRQIVKSRGWVSKTTSCSRSDPSSIHIHVSSSGTSSSRCGTMCRGYRLPPPAMNPDPNPRCYPGKLVRRRYKETTRGTASSILTYTFSCLEGRNAGCLSIHLLKSIYDTL